MRRRWEPRIGQRVLYGDKLVTIVSTRKSGLTVRDIYGYTHVVTKSKLKLLS